LDIIKVSRSLLNVAYTCANVPLAFRSCVLQRRYSEQIRKNRSFKGSYIGKRCYVIGNGPSLNNVDLKKLVGKDLITVNKFFQHPYYENLRPIFHCAIDPGMYKGDTGSNFLEIIKQEQQTSFLISSNAPNDFKACSNTYITILGYLPSSICHPYDLARPSAGFINVVLVAIELAIYLGFAEIVLLGCDFNQFAVRKEIHSYIEDNSSERAATMFQDLQGHAIAVMQHEWLFSYAQKKKVEIVNASEGSFLDVYPRVKTDTII